MASLEDIMKHEPHQPVDEMFKLAGPMTIDDFNSNINEMKAFIELVLKIAFHQLNKAELAKKEGVPNPACELYESLTAKKPQNEVLDRVDLGQRI